MKNVKKIIALVACAVLLVVGSIAGTIAFLSSTSKVTNTFSVGNVTITMTETDVDVYGVADGTTRVTDNTYKLIPGHEYIKDPIVFVDANSEDAYLFVKVTNEIAAIEADTTVHEQMVDNGFELIDVANNIYAYKGDTLGVIKANDEITVFETLTIKDDADVSAYKDKTLTVKACAIQKDGFSDLNEAFAKLPADAFN